MFGWKANRHLTRELEIEPPAPEKNRQGIAIVACVKNEETYIEEWVRFHRAVGVRHFHIYNDGSTDATLDVLRNILSPAELTVVPWKMRMQDSRSGEILNGQNIAYAHAILNFGGRYRWMAFIDVDEFLLPRKGQTLDSALQGASGFPNVSLPWHMFGHSGHVSRPSQPVSLSYTMRVPDPMRQNLDASNFKCIVDPVEVTGVSVHHFKTRDHGDVTVNDAGKKFSRRGRKMSEFYSSEFIQLNHYYARSKEELQEKLDRGWSFDSSSQKYQQKVLATIRYIEDNVIEDRRMVDFINENAIALRG
ncbi:hypothetical protein QO002_005073 [Pararhizobium capsulatum DSM 1112]|uniref:Glycosyltransferase family 92 protein n=1 Tax=Pararhizobium capsulatum DSM 1112 TaxID=1121113 RepID=A0ABU0C187_9HYPH|nr:glycosyltransferase family 92 protein [Pararhizobium capsulatum]MDQ0322867.1 hypothetical protein [Pararhizobium capsulatum DSM 1112]